MEQYAGKYLQYLNNLKMHNLHHNVTPEGFKYEVHRFSNGSDIILYKIVDNMYHIDDKNIVEACYENLNRFCLCRNFKCRNFDDTIYGKHFYFDSYNYDPDEYPITYNSTKSFIPVFGESFIQPSVIITGYKQINDFSY